MVEAEADMLDDEETEELDVLALAELLEAAATELDEGTAMVTPADAQRLRPNSTVAGRGLVSLWTERSGGQTYLLHRRQSRSLQRIAGRGLDRLCLCRDMLGR